MTIIANPIAASAAAIVKINIVNICPTISLEKIENEIKLMFTANKINSIDIKITMTFFLFKKIPSTPKRKLLLQELNNVLNQFQSSILTPLFVSTSLSSIAEDRLLEICFNNFVSLRQVFV